MTWVKQNYDRFVLALFAAALLACAGLLFNNVRNYNDVFNVLKGQVTQNRTLPVNVDPKNVAAEVTNLDTPDTWAARMIDNRRLPLFVSVPYIAKTIVDPVNGTAKTVLIDPFTGDPSGMLHPPVPNKWLDDNKQDMLAQNVLDQDSDGDGFTTLDEFLGKTNPSDPKSHPPYWTKLVLTRLVRQPFRLIFDAGTGPFQINTLDLDQPTQFLKVGDMVRGTKFKLTKYEHKEKKDNGMTRDVSEVTLVNTETNEPIVLPKQQEVDSPTTYAVLTYLWTGKQFGVKKNQEFTLKPEDNVKYRCVELNDTDVKVIKEDENKDLYIKKQAPQLPVAR